VFDYPLTVREVHRYLAGVSTSFSLVKDTLDNDLLSGRRLVCHRGYVTLPGRESIVETRLRRQAVCARLWPKGIRYGLAIASLPFVRFVAVTGTLAVDNLEQGADIDYLIATVPGRVWLARLLTVLIVHIGRLTGLEICPNYVISVDALEQFDHSLFTAHELAQMVPLYGWDVYEELVQANDWAQCFLPNAFAAARDLPKREIGSLSRALKWVGERLLRGKLGDRLERREMDYKIARLMNQAVCRDTSAAVFTPHCCKGHLDDHGDRIGKAYAERLRRLGLERDGATSLPACGCALPARRTQVEDKDNAH
jgi:hypothetical protein